jgi:2-methylisocitrate lyase-like PEP mutase family enzyme
MPSFRDLHHGNLPLILPNAWDVPSALMLLDAGFTAIGTTSCGVAVSHGVPDGAGSTKDANLTLATALHQLDCHVSIDVEDGYSADPDEVAAYVAGLPADGINIEDSTAGALIDPATHAAKIGAIKARSPEIFVNARVDTYWFGEGADVATTVARAERYVEAGADGVFVPGVSDADLLRSLASAIDRPLNVLAISGSSPADLGALGVRRISTGSLPYRAALTAAVAAAVATRDGLTFPGAVSYPDLQNLMIRYTEGR